MTKHYWLLAAFLLLNGCVAKPVIDKAHKGCDTTSYTYKIKYDKAGKDLPLICDGMKNEAALACLAVVGLSLPITTTLYAGSIVIYKNTVHWLEYQQQCPSNLSENQQHISKQA
ncbi:hypothetical protein [Thalassotalea maritima]|uniref:hypothetical protein n=1 Tax=Thalassotalea maritima TaxID=3242416 RepID=UPI003529490A